jgi:predicted lipoprotein
MLIPFSTLMIIRSGGNIMSLNFERIRKLLLFIRWRIPWFKFRCLTLITLSLLGTFLLTILGCKQGDYYLFYLVEEKAEKKEEGANRLEYFKEEKFDADKIVADIWDSKVIPTILEQAVELTTVLDALANNPEAAGQKYGHREKGGDYPWNFIVKGEGRIITVNTKSRKGTLTIDVPPYDGKPDATIWIGPIITSYSIRDSLDFISFTSGVGSSKVQYKFDTQVQFAELSNALNARGNKNILATLEPMMCFKLTEASFESLKEKKIPDNVLDNLNSLKDNTCTSKEQFWETVKEQVGGEVEQYQADVLKSADTSDTAKGRQVRFYGAITQERSGAIIITPVQLEFVKEGQS